MRITLLVATDTEPNAAPLVLADDALEWYLLNGFSPTGGVQVQTTQPIRSAGVRNFNRRNNAERLSLPVLRKFDSPAASLAWLIDEKIDKQGRSGTLQILQSDAEGTAERYLLEAVIQSVNITQFLARAVVVQYDIVGSLYSTSST